MKLKRFRTTGLTSNPNRSVTVTVTRPKRSQGMLFDLQYNTFKINLLFNFECRLQASPDVNFIRSQLHGPQKLYLYSILMHDIIKTVCTKV